MGRAWEGFALLASVALELPNPTSGLADGAVGTSIAVASVHRGLSRCLLAWAGVHGWWWWLPLVSVHSHGLPSPDGAAAYMNDAMGHNVVVVGLAFIG